MNCAAELIYSYDWCHRVSRSSGSSFYRAFGLLPQQQRRALFALYAFARITDDLSDEVSDEVSYHVTHNDRDEGHSTGGETLPDSKHASRTERLMAWQSMLRQQLARDIPRLDASPAASQFSLGDPNHRSESFSPIPVPAVQHKQLCKTIAQGPSSDAVTASLSQYDWLWPALHHTVVTYQIPVRLLDELVAGVVMDLQAVRLADWPAVDEYCYRVASTVGLACTSIWQARPSLPQQAAIDCGLAFQLTNILRDLREDAQRDRIYLPIDQLQRFGCDTDSWLAGKPRGEWLQLVSSVLERARALYHSGARTVDHLPPHGARMFALMWSSYRHLLEAIEHNKEHLWSDRRVRVPRHQLWSALLRSWLAPTSSGSLLRTQRRTHHNA